MERQTVRPGVSLAWRSDGPPDDGRTVGYVWLGGFRSDMTGSKAETVAELARRTSRPLLRFDYSGHGASQGNFEDGTISLWLDEAIHMFRTHTLGPRIVIGSSMGGWLALLLARALEGRRIAGLLLIAPAVDMTESLMWQRFRPEIRETLTREGLWLRPSPYGEPYPITRRLIEDGRRHLLLQEDIVVDCPVHILQGDADEEVPWQHALQTYQGMAGPDVRLTLVRNGDHRLSSPRQLEILAEAADALARQVQQGRHDSQET